MPADMRSGKDFTLALSEGLRDRVRNPTIDRYEPHPKQRRFHKSDYPGRQFLGGNRSGKTVGGCSEGVFYSLDEHPFKELPWKPPIRGRIETVDLLQGMEKIIIPELKRWVPPRALIKGSWDRSWSKQDRTLNLVNKSFIEILTYEQELEKHAGTSRHWVWFDEEPPREIFKECMLRLLDVGGHWWMTMTPIEGITWTYNEIYESGDPNIDIIVVDTDENPYVDEAGKKLVFSGLNEQELQARKRGIYIHLGGLIYSNDFDWDFNVIEPITPPIDWYLISSMDHGGTNPTCWLWGCVSPDGRLIIYDEYYEGNRLVFENAQSVHEKEVRFPKRPVERVGDPSIWSKDPITGTSIGIEYAEGGLFIAKGNNDVRAGIDRVKKLMRKKKLFITRNCVKTLWELKRYRWKMYKSKDARQNQNVPEEPMKKDDHAMDTLRYLVAARPELDIPDPEPVKRNLIGAPVAMSAMRPVYDREFTDSDDKKYDSYFGEYY